jgi:hypothetical protein
MKKILVLLFSLSFLFISCDKEESQVNDLFKTPIIDWTLNKSQVKAKETLTLIEDLSEEDILLLIGPWESQGDGSLKYSGDSFFTSIQYGFYNNSKTLECARCVFNFTNKTTEESVLSFMQRKYNDEYVICKTDDGTNYIFYTSFGMVVLEVKSVGIITFTKKKHEWYYK